MAMIRSHPSFLKNENLNYWRYQMWNIKVFNIKVAASIIKVFVDGMPLENIPYTKGLIIRRRILL